MIMTEEQIKALPVEDPPVTVRIKFRKIGRLQYISHLDLQRTMERVIARTGLPVWYTKGFNPHIKLVFALPLPVGVESECELLDLRLDKDVPSETIKAMLNAGLTDELNVIEVYESAKKFVEIDYADYRYRIKTDGASEELAEKIAHTLSVSPLNIIKKTKTGDKETDIVPMIRKVKVDCISGEGEIEMFLKLACGQRENLNPQAVISALRENTGILSHSPIEEKCRIFRERIYDMDGNPFY